MVDILLSFPTSQLGAQITPTQPAGFFTVVEDSTVKCWAIADKAAVIASYVADPNFGGWVQLDSGDTTRRVLWLDSAGTVTINVKSYGARGDGVTDDTAAIQAAIVAAQTAVATDFWTDCFPAVFLPPGSYLVTGIDITMPIRLYGAGSHQTVLALKAAANRSLVKFVAPVNGVTPVAAAQAPVYHPLIDSMALNCNGAAQAATSHGIEVVATAHVLATRYDVGPKMRDLLIQSARDNGVFIGANRNMGFMERCIVKYNGGSGVLSNAYDWRISDCDFGTSTSASGWQQSAGGETSFTGCYFYTNGLHGLVFNSLCNAPCHVVNCSFDGNTQYGLWMDCNSDVQVSHHVIGCRFTLNSLGGNNTYSDIHVQNAPSPSVVSHCAFVKGAGAVFPKYMVEIDATSFLNWSNNTFSQATPPYVTATADRPGQVRSNYDSARVQVFLANGTWTKPIGVTQVQVTAIGPGAGGGAGRRGAAGSVRCGGGGGGGGGRVHQTFDASLLGATEAVAVGAIGTGGAAQTADNSDGAPGVSAGICTFGTTVLVRAFGGFAGGGGTATAGTAGAAGNSGGAGGAASGSGGVGGVSQTGVGGGAGGAAGGGITSGDAESAGGNGATGPAVGGAGAGGNAGAAGNTGGTSTSSPVNSPAAASGAGGGGACKTAAAGAGGVGGNYGAGGGGGGASLNGFNSGAGGNGGTGIVVVTSW